MANIIIENLRRIHNKGNLRAFCDVRLPTPRGDWLLRSCKIVQEVGKKAMMDKARDEKW